MLFWKRLDEFRLQTGSAPGRKDFAHPKAQPELVTELLEDKTSYGETFFVPIRACWHEVWKAENGDLVPALKDQAQHRQHAQQSDRRHRG